MSRRRSPMKNKRLRKLNPTRRHVLFRGTTVSREPQHAHVRYRPIYVSDEQRAILALAGINARTRYHILETTNGGIFYHHKKG